MYVVELIEGFILRDEDDEMILHLRHAYINSVFISSALTC